MRFLKGVISVIYKILLCTQLTALNQTKINGLRNAVVTYPKNNEVTSGKLQYHLLSQAINSRFTLFKLFNRWYPVPQRMHHAKTSIPNSCWKCGKLEMLSIVGKHALNSQLFGKKPTATSLPSNDNIIPFTLECILLHFF